MIYIGLDFDGTCVKHCYPFIGDDIPFCVDVLNEMIAHDIKICLNTMRSGKTLEDAVNWFKERNIPLYGINKNPTQSSWTSSPKVYAHLYIDDAALGCPLIYDKTGVFVDWIKVREYLVLNNYIK